MPVSNDEFAENLLKHNEACDGVGKAIAGSVEFFINSSTMCAFKVVGRNDANRGTTVNVVCLETAEFLESHPNLNKKVFFVYPCGYFTYWRNTVPKEWKKGAGRHVRGDYYFLVDPPSVGVKK